MKLNVYVGAYFEIKTSQQRYQTGWLICPNGHKCRGAHFCPDCGQGVKPEWADGYPADIIELGLEGELNEELWGITPPDLYGTGVIIATGNDTLRGGCAWQWYSPHDENHTIAELPSIEDRARMAALLFGEYGAVYQALLELPAVSSVRVAVGIVPYFD